MRDQRLEQVDLSHIADRYDAGIAYADAQLGPLLAELSMPEHAARTLIVITADHGESLLDHPERLFTHDPFLFSAVTRIPLLVRYPGGKGAGAVRGDLVSLIDVAPTVLALLGIDPQPTFAGRSLLELEQVANWYERVVYQECWGWSRLAAARSDHWLALRDVLTGGTHVFDLDQDPHERRALSPASHPLAEGLVSRLEAFVGRLPADAVPHELEPEVLHRLRQLGYTQR